MSDSYTEVTSRSWGSRLRGSIKGILVGLLLVVIAVALLWWNEGRAVKRARALEEGAGQVVSASANERNTALEGKLVHMTGLASTDETLRDTQFGLARQSLKLRRVVQIYQWREKSHSETKEKLGGGTETKTTYTYEKAWETSLQDSSRFKRPEGHRNPDRMPYRAWSSVAGTVTLGVFRLSAALVDEIGGYHQVSLSAPGVADSLRIPAGMRQQADELYLGADPLSPRIGDMRIHFEAVDPQNVSIVSVQKGDSFVPYVAANGNQVELLESGIQTADQMFQAAQDRNTMLTWGLRLLGYILMFIGFRMLFGTIRILAAVIPALGRLVGGAIGLVAGILAAVVSLVVVAIAWVFYRPLLGIGLLAAAVALLFGLKKVKREDAPVMSPASPPPPPPPR